MPRQKSCKLKLSLPKGSLYRRWSQLCEAAFTPRGDSTNCNSRVSMLQRAPRRWSGVHYHHWSYGHFRWPFQQPLSGKKNIRFTPTNSSNPILMAHSCGLGGKYWYKHTEVFQTENLKRLVQCGLETWFFPFGRRCQRDSEANVISI